MTPSFNCWCLVREQVSQEQRCECVLGRDGFEITEEHLDGGGD